MAIALVSLPTSPGDGRARPITIAIPGTTPMIGITVMDQNQIIGSLTTLLGCCSFRRRERSGEWEMRHRLVSASGRQQDDGTEHHHHGLVARVVCFPCASVDGSRIVTTAVHSGEGGCDAPALSYGCLVLPARMHHRMITWCDGWDGAHVHHCTSVVRSSSAAQHGTAVRDAPDRVRKPASGLGFTIAHDEHTGSPRTESSYRSLMHASITVQDTPRTGSMVHWRWMR